MFTFFLLIQDPNHQNNTKFKVAPVEMSISNPVSSSVVSVYTSSKGHKISNISKIKKSSRSGQIILGNFSYLSNDLGKKNNKNKGNRVTH